MGCLQPFFQIKRKIQYSAMSLECWHRQSFGNILKITIKEHFCRYMSLFFTFDMFSVSSRECPFSQAEMQETKDVWLERDFQQRKHRQHKINMFVLMWYVWYGFSLCLPISKIPHNHKILRSYKGTKKEIMRH